MTKNSAACFGEIPRGGQWALSPSLAGLFNRPLETLKTPEITAVADRWAIQNSALCWVIPSPFQKKWGSGYVCKVPSTGLSA